MSTPVLILAFANDPDAHLDLLKAEGKELFHALRDLDRQEFIKVHREESATAEDIFDALIAFKDQVVIFHYGGHVDGATLRLEGGAGHAGGIAGLLGEQANLKLVFLNGCATKSQVEALMDAGVKSVVATSVPIGDRKAMEFSARFYEALANRRTIGQAFELAQSFLQTKHGATRETQMVVHRGPQAVAGEEVTEALAWGLYVKEEDEEEVLNWQLPREDGRISEGGGTSEQVGKVRGHVLPGGGDLEDRYRIVEVLGEGGMGTVYLADDLRHDRRVAIKTVRHGFIDESLLQRFEREIKLTSSLQHPRILPLLDSGVTDGALYYVMQYIDGESLEERLAREGQLPIDDALRIARHVADALDYAHSHGVVHRDIKPANIMLSGDHSFVMDFGIALALTTSPDSLTSAGSAMGTPMYMSPEQVADSSTVDGRSDIYALGCVLYEMLAGHPPFTGRTGDSIARQHLAAEPMDVRVHRPSTPHDVSAAIFRALSKSPADRFQTGRELIQTLETHPAGVGAPGASGPRVRTAFLVIAGYLAGCWGVLAIVERVAEMANLPASTVPFALVLLLVGLLVVVATTLVQATGSRLGVSGNTDLAMMGAGHRLMPARGRRLLSLFRWRNVVVGGVVAFALWGLVAMGLLVVPRRSDGPARDNAESVSSDESAATVARPDGLRGTPGEGAVAETPEAVTADPAAAPAEAEPSAVDSEATAAFVLVREGASAARADADVAGARLAVMPGLVRADSLWREAGRAENAGRQGDAAQAYTLAGQAYSETARDARAIFAARVDSVRSSLVALRRRANPETAPYAEGARLEASGAQAEREGDLPVALDALMGAASAYGRALAAAESPPAAVDEPSPADPAPVAPSPSERVIAAMTALERAFEAEDLAAVERVWVNLTSANIRSFREFFANGSSMDYQFELDPASIRSVPAGIEFRVTAHWEYLDDQDDQLVSQPPFQQSFRLERSDAADVLISR